MKIEKTSLDNVLMIEPEFRFEDHRGDTVCAFEGDSFAQELWKADISYAPAFSKHNFSVSYKNVLRGIHISNCYKLCYCPFGSIYLVAVDCRAGSKDFGKWEPFAVNGDSRKMILIPPQFGLAHLIESQVAVFYYHWSAEFDGDKQQSYRWDSFGIEWPVKDPILSERDKNSTYLFFKRETPGFGDAPAEQLRKMAEEDRR